MRALGHRLASLLIAVLLLLSASSVRAATKEECLEAHGRGQVEREKGQLTRARHTLTACAQASCPSLVQADCARMSEELAHLVPTVTFVMRDAGGADLPATSVYVDDVLVTTRLDDGKSYEVDPGKHTVRYVHESGEATLRVVVNQGEKGRVLAATVGASPGAVASSASTPTSPARVSAPRAALAPDPPEAKRSTLPLGVAAVGAAVVVTGAVITGIGLSNVPSRCKVSTSECATAPNDPAIGAAQSAVSLADKGLGIGIAGAVVLAGGVVWYLLSPAHPDGARRGQLPSNVITF